MHHSPEKIKLELLFDPLATGYFSADTSTTVPRVPTSDVPRHDRLVDIFET